MMNYTTKLELIFNISSGLPKGRSNKVTSNPSKTNTPKERITTIKQMKKN